MEITKPRTLPIINLFPSNDSADHSPSESSLPFLMNCTEDAALHSINLAPVDSYAADLSEEQFSVQITPNNFSYNLLQVNALTSQASSDNSLALISCDATTPLDHPGAAYVARGVLSWSSPPTAMIPYSETASHCNLSYTASGGESTTPNVHYIMITPSPTDASSLLDWSSREKSSGVLLPDLTSYTNVSSTATNSKGSSSTTNPSIRAGIAAGSLLALILILLSAAAMWKEIRDMRNPHSSPPQSTTHPARRPPPPYSSLATKNRNPLPLTPPPPTPQPHPPRTQPNHSNSREGRVLNLHRDLPARQRDLHPALPARLPPPLRRLLARERIDDVSAVQEGGGCVASAA